MAFERTQPGEETSAPAVPQRNASESQKNGAGQEISLAGPDHASLVSPGMNSAQPGRWIYEPSPTSCPGPNQTTCSSLPEQHPQG